MTRRAALRPVGALRLPPHRASSATLAGAYPWLTVRPPQRGVPIGVDAISGAPFAFDPWTLYSDGWLTNPNVLLAGVIGQGKSALAKTIALRSVAAGRRVFVAGDPKGEWAPVATAVGGQVVRLGPGLPARLNPLEAAGSAADAGEGHARRLQLLGSLAQQALGRPLRPVEHTALDEALRAACCPTVTLNDVTDALLHRSEPRAPGGPAAVQLARDTRDVAHALRRTVTGDLAGMFDGRSTITLNAAAPVVVLDLSRLSGNDDAIALAMTCGAAWLDTALDTALAAEGRSPGQRWVIYDEAWRLLRSLPLVRQMQSRWKLSRALGVANLLVLHRLSDLDAAGAHGSEIRAVADGLLADCSTRVVYRQEPDQLAGTAGLLGLTEPERAVIARLSRGVGLWKLPDGSFIVRHTLHPAEQPIVDTDLAMRDTPSGLTPRPATAGSGGSS
jgi:type IV secretory pathway VirB4 component